MSLTEYGTQRLLLAARDRDYLAALALRDTGSEAAVITGLIPTGAQPNEFAASVGGYLGRLGLPSGDSLDVESRFPAIDPIEVLRVALALPASLPLMAAQAGSAPLLPDIIAAAFCREVETLVSRGLAKAYTHRLNTGPPYAGKLCPDLHLRRHAGRPDRLITESKLLTLDTGPNQALLRALLLLRRLPLGGDLPQRLRRLMPVFSTVSVRRMTARKISCLGLTRLTSRYECALSLAAVVVAGSSIGPVGNDLAGNSLMFYMPGAWEKYVAARLTKALPHLTVTTSHKFQVSDAGHVAVADCLVSSATSTIAVVDAKYKNQHKAPSSDDIYQMVTYCHRLQVPRAILVYPQAIVDRVVNVGEIAIHVVGLDTADAHRAASFDTRVTALLQPVFVAA